jgi:hypothetical protein
MSAPKTNIDRQVSRHRGPLLGMLAVVGFVAILFLGWLLYEAGGTDASDLPVDPAATEGGAETAPAPATPAPAAPSNP